LKEVLINLLENARAAMPSGGTVRVEAEARGGGIDLTVRDNGTGIPAELLTRVFEPHFSTRTTGTGLGLAIVRRLVESWGGRVHAEILPEGGTALCLRLLPWQGGTDPRPADGREGGERGSGEPLNS
jgi:signal transduction histidine kinase